MKTNGYTIEALTSKWEDLREIKNLMGKYSMSVVLMRHRTIFKDFWSAREDVCLGFNHGYYKGGEAVREYYRSYGDSIMKTSGYMQKLFPAELGKLSEEELFGTGRFEMKPLTSPVIALSGDGETAKGLWCCLGAESGVDERGPLSSWTWGYCAVDFVREADGWKIWHLQALEDVKFLGGQSWGKVEEVYPPLPEFAELGDFKLPAPNVPRTVRARYGADRPLTPPPRIPEPYETFKKTFSYGV